MPTPGSDEKTRITVIAVAVVEANDQFLVGRRPAGKPLAGMWEFPGGKVEAGESPESAAIRECREETGVTVVVRGEFAPRHESYPHGTVRLHFFHCSPLEPLPVPQSPFRWIARPELSQLEFPSGNEELLREILTAAPRKTIAETGAG